MALPQQVLERINQAPPADSTPGWSWGLLSFAGGILLITIIIYAGLQFGYEPYINKQISSMNAQITQYDNSISPQDEAGFLTYYSEITNFKKILDSHVEFSHFFSWLEKNTEGNVFYKNMSFSSGNEVSLSGSASSEADANQQLAIFQSSPDLQSFTFSGVSLDSSGRWDFGVTLKMQPFSGLTP